MLSVPPTLRKYTVLNGNFVFDLRATFSGMQSLHKMRSACSLLMISFHCVTLSFAVEVKLLHSGLNIKCTYFCFLQIISKDSNVIVVAVAGKCLAGLANGLKKRFQPYASACIPCILEKFREKKQNVVTAMREAIDAIFLSVSPFFLFVSL